jgi:hypothetical protein
MPFSLGSYLLGVATVLGALAFGFGGGVLLTHTAMKESPARQKKVERLVRAEPETSAATQAPAAQTPAPTTPPDGLKQNAAPAEQPVAVSADPVPAAPKPDATRKPVREAPKQIQAARVQQPKHVEQIERAEAKPVEPREADRSRSRRYVERTQPGDAPRMRQRGFMVQEELSQDAIPSRSLQRNLPLFAGFFGRPADANE